MYVSKHEVALTFPIDLTLNDVGLKKCAKWILKKVHQKR